MDSGSAGQWPAFTTITAGDPRADLGPYNGNHGLTWAIPVAWKDGQGRTIQLRSQGTILDVLGNAGAGIPPASGTATVNGNTVTLTCAPNAQKALYFIEPDHLGTPRNVQNQTQQTVWRWDQNEAFGNNAPNENPSNLGAFVFPLRFPGQYADVETGLFYNYFRDYNPVVGGYWQSDPIGLRGGSLSTYGYVNGSPLILADPMGLFVGPWHYAMSFASMTTHGYSGGMADVVAGFVVGADWVRGSQKTENSHWHAMCHQSWGKKKCKEKFDEFINAQITSCTWKGLGRALHAAQDSAAAGHGGQDWLGGIPSQDHRNADIWPTRGEIADAMNNSSDIIKRFKAACPCMAPLK